jgi:hypothetical protein
MEQLERLGLQQQNWFGQLVLEYTMNGSLLEQGLEWISFPS